MSSVGSNRIASNAIRIRSAMTTTSSCSSVFTSCWWCLFPPVWKTYKLPTIVFLMTMSAAMGESDYTMDPSRVFFCLRWFLRGDETDIIVLCFLFLSRSELLFFSDYSGIRSAKINGRVCSYNPLTDDSKPSFI